MERDLRNEFIETWDNLVPKVLDLAKDSEIAGLSQFLTAHGCGEVSDGKL